MPKSSQYPQYQPSVPPRSHHRSLWDKTWKDKNGRVVMWQTPNIWLISWAVLTTISLFFTGHTADGLSATASATLIIWSLLEIFRGINYYRRVLGVAVLAYALAALLKSL
jgi:hypothetical protein